MDTGFSLDYSRFSYVTAESWKLGINGFLYSLGQNFVENHIFGHVYETLGPLDWHTCISIVFIFLFSVVRSLRLLFHFWCFQHRFGKTKNPRASVLPIVEPNFFKIFRKSQWVCKFNKNSYQLLSLYTGKPLHLALYSNWVIDTNPVHYSLFPLRRYVDMDAFVSMQLLEYAPDLCMARQHPPSSPEIYPTDPPANC